MVNTSSRGVPLSRSFPKPPFFLRHEHSFSEDELDQLREMPDRAIKMIEQRAEES